MGDDAKKAGLGKSLLGLVVVLVLGALGYGKLGGEKSATDGGESGSRPEIANPSTRTEAPSPGTGESGTEAALASSRKIEALFRDRESGVVVETEGTVVTLLRDDNEGSRHQLFILKLATGITVKVSHNIDLAPRVPVEKGDRIRIRGQYEWNDKGGVLHWTHHDPGGRRPGGWIELDGKRYR
ncbi:MAG: DUF3465 domain-containing protein [Planctomycetota bacterium]